MKKLQLEMSDAPVAATTEASMKFLNGVIQGDFAMQTSVKTPQSQTAQLISKGLDACAISMCHADALSGILAAIAMLSNDDTIAKLAAHGKDVADRLHNEADCFREDVENLALGV